MLSEAERSTLTIYDISERGGAYALQELTFSRILERKGFLAWRGRWLGASMYSITDAGRRALKGE